MYRACLPASLLIIGVAGCKTKPSGTTAGSGSARVATAAGSAGSASGSGSVAAAPTIAPEERARAMLQRQIDAALKNDADAFIATFASDAIVFVVNKGPITPDSDTSGELGGIGPDGAGITQSTIAKVVANGTADAVWFYAEVTETDPDDSRVIPSSKHVVELLTADKGWHVVAASFDAGYDVHPGGDNVEVPGATPAVGPLAKLVPPTALGASVAPDAIVVGPKGVSDLAGLKALEPLTIYKSAKEVHAAGYGFLQSTADRPRPGGKLIERVNVQLFAVPNADKSWKIVLAQYGGQ